MSDRVRWGVLGVANIAVRKVIPAMQRGEHATVVAIASRDLDRAQRAAKSLGIPRAHGTYEALLADPDVEAIYNPLPNHLHVPWSVRAAAAGKHVLCEKPVALDVAGVRELIAARDASDVQIGEAFMVRSNLQWLAARELVREGRLGELRAAQGFFSYYLTDPDNVRNIRDMGGGGLMDIGCYPVNTARFVFGEEPLRVVGVMERDPQMDIDRLTSAILEFPSGQCTFTCSTQLVPYQRMHFFGTAARLEVEIPFNAPNDRPCRIFIGEGGAQGEKMETRQFPVSDQYGLQGDQFSRSIRGLESAVAVPLEDSLRNMAVIDALFRSADSGAWETPL